MKAMNTKRTAKPRKLHQDDPNGYIVSENYGDDLYHYDTLARAIQGAKDAVAEGAKQADVWHAVGEFSVEIDYDLGIEWTVTPDGEGN